MIESGLELHPDVQRCQGAYCAMRSTCLRYLDRESGSGEAFEHMCGPKKQYHVLKIHLLRGERAKGSKGIYGWAALCAITEHS